MPFIPHTLSEEREMLATIGANSMEDLFDEIPASLRKVALEKVPEGMTELAISQLMHARAAQDQGLICFAGAGAYEHHIPAAVWDIASRGEFLTAYTPYQAEASQGTLQLLYEYQSMMSQLMHMEVSNASMYDGASALAEAVLMAVRGNRKTKSRVVLMPRTVNPAYRYAVEDIVHNADIEIVEIPFCSKRGITTIELLEKHAPKEFAALVIPQPNFFGALEPVDELTNWAHAHQAWAIAVVNPVSMALLKPPGAWGETGVEVACGEGQPLGIPLSSGGPYFGFFCAKKEHVRQMPGRIIGRTVDTDGKQGFALTLQAREQHIRRAKATSNICTNQGLMVTAATIFMSLLGSEGLKRVAATSYATTQSLVAELSQVDKIAPVFAQHAFHERLLQLPISGNEAVNELAKHGILGGFAVENDYPELPNTLLVCATEVRTAEDIKAYKKALTEVLASHKKSAAHNTIVSATGTE